MKKTNVMDPNEAGIKWWEEPGLPDVIADIGRWMGGEVVPPARSKNFAPNRRFIWRTSGPRSIVHSEGDDLLVNLVTFNPPRDSTSETIFVGTEETARDIFEWLRTGVLPGEEER